MVETSRCIFSILHKLMSMTTMIASLTASLSTACRHAITWQQFGLTFHLLNNTNRSQCEVNPSTHTFGFMSIKNVEVVLLCYI
mmetsp:Transcript_23480/g.34460  ORF Transcript_23480/g.34460 Transcript_23480/m.34460 type:complete len:83 (+) Transcript_23480:1435-1683(+)